MEKKQTFGELFRRWGLKSIKLNGKFAQLEFEAMVLIVCMGYQQKYQILKGIYLKNKFIMKLMMRMKY